MIYKKKKKKKTTNSWWEVLHSSQPSGTLQVDRYHPQRIFLGQHGQHEQHPHHLEGRGWFHRQKTRRFLQSRQAGLESKPGHQWRCGKGPSPGKRP